MLPCIEFLFEHLHGVRTRLEALPHRESMLQAVNQAIAKLEAYYAKTDENVAVVAALVMNPMFKWSYLRHKWTGQDERQWLRTAQGKVQRLWDFYKQQDLPIQDVTIDDSAPTEDSIDNFLRLHLPRMTWSLLTMNTSAIVALL